jgi:hypothetical protein
MYRFITFNKAKMEIGTIPTSILHAAHRVKY